MAVSTTFVATAGYVHQGPGFVFWNILRPLFNMRPLIGPGNPPTITDHANPAAWVKSTSYTAGAIVGSSASDNLVVVCTTAGTAGAGSEPAWNSTIGASTTDGTATWMTCGPNWVWKAAQAVIFDQQVRSGNNIWQCIVPGTTQSSGPQPSDVGIPVGGLVIDGTVEWMNLGPSLALGANEGAITFKMTPKMTPIMADQYTSPLDFVTTAEDGEIDGTLEELSATNVSRIMPNTILTQAATDPNFPVNATTYNQSTFGGSLRVPRPCVAVCSPKRQFGSNTSLTTQPFRYFMGVIYAAGPKSDGTLPFSLQKNTSYKVAITGSAVTWRPSGDQVGTLIEQV